MTDRYRVIGGNGSPYSMKLRAIMRYRRLPFDWVLRTEKEREALRGLKVQLMPILRLPEDGALLIDSTPIAYELEARHPGVRSIIPDDPGHAFLSHLIEDMADEWGTKCMFHLRWEREADQEYCSHWIIQDARPELRGAEYEAAVREIRERQVGRMALVGCTPHNAPVIHETFRKVLAILEPHVGLGHYLFGSRPSLADFGWFGQLKTLASDPTPQTIMRETAQCVESWVRQLDDASGVEGEWISAEDPLPEVVLEMLRLAGEAYLPFLRANAEAIVRGKDEISLTIFGKPYNHGVMKYQAKCREWLTKELAGLDGAPLARTRTALEETNCWEILQPG